MTIYKENGYGENIKETTNSSLSIGLQLTTRKPSHHKAGYNWSQNNFIHRYSEIVVKFKQNIQRPEIPEMARQLNAAWLKYFGLITTLTPVKLATVENYYTLKHT